jgi:ribosomal protein L29
MADDVVISVVLMAYHRGASIRGMQIACKSLTGKLPCAGTVIRWKRKFASVVCDICFNVKSVGQIRLCQGSIISSKLESKCARFIPKFLPSDIYEKAKLFFLTNDWKPYPGVGHPGRRAKYDQKEWENRYCREYYRTHPAYAKTLLKHPENLYVRLKLRQLSVEEKAEHKRKRHREWAREKYRKQHGGKVNEEMSRRGRKGAEVRWGRKYN